MSTPRRLALHLGAIALLSLPAAARAADVFSPGDLSRPHASLAGIENCTKCHPRGEQLSRQQCLECHKELSPRLAEGRGLHGRLAEKDRDCWACHHEHQGSDFALVDWGPGGPGKLDHARTGVRLGGKHAAVGCQRCHDARLVREPAVKALLARAPQRRTYLGAPPMAECAACHFDEHRGQLGAECRRCHSDAAWKPAGGFDHARTQYALTGKHARVACEKCHPGVEGEPAAPGALTRPVSPVRYARYRPVAHEACLDCHKDPHAGRLGAACASCHATDDWKHLSQGAVSQRAFHDRTRYPLAGAHQAAACVACHGPFRGEPAVFKPLAFQACTDCHADAHAGQLARRGAPAGACERCHDVQGWQPARFGLEEHQRLPYRLEGAHQVVGCPSCHRPDPALAARLPAATRAELQRRGRPLRASPTVYAIAGDLGRCETCHADPHRGQLARPGGCATCHSLESFRKVRLDHARDTRYRLTGKHATAACGACHPTEPTASGPAVRYRPLSLACDGCHADAHAGQLGAAPEPEALGPVTADAAAGRCAPCHAPDDWKKSPFRHEPPFTSYALTGKHRKVACERCHPAVPVGNDLTVRRYRPLPTACQACHADFHRGAFRGFEPRSR